MARLAMGAARYAAQVTFPLNRVPRHGLSRKPELVFATLTIQPAHDGDPALRLALPAECGWP